MGNCNVAINIDQKILLTFFIIESTIYCYGWGNLDLNNDLFPLDIA